jgi:hypothetical protein
MNFASFGESLVVPITLASGANMRAFCELIGCGVILSTRFYEILFSTRLSQKEFIARMSPDFKNLYRKNLLRNL